MDRNTLYYGDNLAILREHVAAASVDLVYLDPPFNSNRSYNVLFRQESGQESEAQVQAFDDTWHWNQQAAETYHELVQHGPPAVANMLGALRQFIGTNQMLAYLVMMAARLVELQRVLKPTGSLYLHCDPTASHYLKVVLDTIFGPQMFVNEVIWKRTSSHSDAKQGATHYGRAHDVLLFYSKNGDLTWHPQYLQHDGTYIKSHYPYTEAETGRQYGLWDITGPGGAAKGNPYYEIFGVSKYWRYSKEKMEQKIREGKVIQPNPGSIPREKRYLDESAGTPVTSLWTDIPPINSQAQERLGYPTQKPVALLERIIAASSNPGDVVLDPFCGCGTTIAAAERLGRRWLGIDITYLAISLQKYRLKSAFDLDERRDYAVVGEPVDLAGARQLAQDDRYQFQWWALGLVQAQPLGGHAGSKQGKKGADQGVDGQVAFVDDAGGKTKRVLVQVKSGQVSAATMRDLRGVVEREGAAVGVLITLEPPTPPMLAEAASAGHYESPGWGQSYPRLQVLTVEGLLHGAQRLAMPPQTQTAVTFKQAPKEAPGRAAQPGLGLE